MARVNVFLPETLLKAIDAEAKARGTSRSALIQGALNDHLEAKRREREEMAVRRDMEEAARGLDAIAEKLGDWDPVRIIRSFRDSRSVRIAEPRARYRPRKSKKRS